MNYLIFSIPGGMCFIREEEKDEDLYKNLCSCSYFIPGLRKRPTTRALEYILTNLTKFFDTKQIILYNIYPRERIKELFEKLVLPIELPAGAFNTRNSVKKAWIICQQKQSI